MHRIAYDVSEAVLDPKDSIKDASHRVSITQMELDRKTIFIHERGMEQDISKYHTLKGVRDFLSLHNFRQLPDPNPYKFIRIKTIDIEN